MRTGAAGTRTAQRGGTGSVLESVFRRHFAGVRPGRGKGAPGSGTGPSGSGALRIRWPSGDAGAVDDSEEVRKRADRPRARSVYAAERRAALRHLELRRELVPVQVTGLVRRMCRVAGLPRIRVLDEFRPVGRACYVAGRPVIRLGPGASRPIDVLHELAHHHAGVGTGHGPEFVKSLVGLVVAAVGKRPALTLARELEAQGIDLRRE